MSSYTVLQQLFFDAARFYRQDEGAPAPSPLRTRPAKPFDASAVNLKSRLPRALTRDDGISEAFSSAFARHDAETVTVQNWGGTATVFEILKPEGEDGFREILRAGMMGYEPLPQFDRVWCPLVLQPSAVEEFGNLSFPGRVERAPLVQMVNLATLDAYILEGVLTEVLAGTPYKIIDGAKDFAALPDATPVTVDADVISFGGDFTAMLKQQSDPAWRQQVMATIDSNCKKLGLEKPFSWVEKDEGGLYRTKQDVIYARAAPRYRAA